MKHERSMPIYFAPDGQPVTGSESPELLGTLALIDGFSKRLMDPSASFEEVMAIHDRAEDIGAKLNKFRSAENASATADYPDPPATTDTSKESISAKLMDRRTSLEELEAIRAQVNRDLLAEK